MTRMTFARPASRRPLEWREEIGSTPRFSTACSPVELRLLRPASSASLSTSGSSLLRSLSDA